MVNITAVKLTDHQIFPWQQLQYVSNDRKVEILKLQNLDDKKRSLISELLMKREAVLTAGIPFDEIQISHNPYGKPYLANIRKFKFNISHSGSYVVIATGKNPVGIDIEYVKQLDMSVAKRFYTDEEYSFLQRIPEEETRVQAFYKLWTLKESYVKAIGKGLRIALNSFEFDENFHLTKLHKPLKKPFSFYTTVFNNHILSVCYLEKEINCKINFIQESDLYDYFPNYRRK